MGLSDLMKEIKQDPQAFLGDESVELRVLGQVLQLVEDKISEVKNQAVKWWAMSHLGFLYVTNHRSSLGQLIKIIRESQMELVVDKLTEFSSSTDEELRDISGLGIPVRLLHSDFYVTRV
jgi:cullin-associated NEDD8-dissociated protein 1